MGKFGHHNFDDQNPNKSQRSSSSSNGKAKKTPIKVRYISSPVKVKARNASEFRAIVQELTGKNSDLPFAEEANQVAEEHQKVASPANGEEFFSHLNSVDQFQFDHEPYFWKEDSAESSSGFQYPNFVSLGDCIYTSI